MNDAATRYGAHLVTPPQVSNRRCVLVLTRTKDYTLIEAAESRTVKVRMFYTTIPRPSNEVCQKKIRIPAEFSGRIRYLTVIAVLNGLLTEARLD